MKNHGIHKVVIGRMNQKRKRRDKKQNKYRGVNKRNLPDMYVIFHQW